MKQPIDTLRSAGDLAAGKGSSRGIRFIFPIRPSHLDGIQRGFPTKTIKEI